MKFLIALSVLASASVFAETSHRDIVKCYETAQGENREVVYKLKKHHGHVRLIYPDSLEQMLARHDGCLESVRSLDDSGRWIRFCRDEGQRVNGLVPVEVKHNNEEETVYCDRQIWHWFGRPDVF